MSINRPRESQSFLNQDVARSVRDMIFSADDMCQPSLRIINYHRQMINRVINISSDNEVFELGSIEFYGAANQIVKSHFFVGVFKTDHFPILPFRLVRNISLAVINELMEIFFIDFRSFRLMPELAFTFDA